MTAKFTNVYEELLAAGIPLDNHESDLYALVTPESIRVIKASGYSYSFFLSNIDGKQWVEVPFAFYPWWERRLSRATANN